VSKKAIFPLTSSDYSGRKGGLLVAIILLAIGVVLQMIVVGSSALVLAPKGPEARSAKYTAS
jgi:hypothetical protein